MVRHPTGPDPPTQGVLAVQASAILAACAVGFNTLRRAFSRCDPFGAVPAYARPLFLRICPQAEITGTFKYAKTDLVRQGFNPSQCADPLYFHHPELRGYAALDAPVYDSILAGAIRF